MAAETAVEVGLSEGLRLGADLVVPEGAEALVVFAHGTGSSRHSPRNRWVASVLQEHGLATLLLDLLTAPEEDLDLRTGQVRFDVGLLTDRVVGAVGWLDTRPDLRDLRVGLFGASTGAAAALAAAARLPDRIGAVVSRGGRPDLAVDTLATVSAPTLLVVGGRDDVVLHLNQQAHDVMQVERRLEVVPGATHLFEEPGALQRVADVAADWFTRHLVSQRGS